MLRQADASWPVRDRPMHTSHVSHVTGGVHGPIAYTMSHDGHNNDKKAQLTQGLRATPPSFQDGGCSKMAVSRHLRYYRTENSAIRSADPQNPSLEPNTE